MTAEEKLADVEHQIGLFGHVERIECPYCGGESLNGEVFCCDTLMKAVAAILQRKQQEDLIEAAERIAERISSN